MTLTWTRHGHLHSTQVWYRADDALLERGEEARDVENRLVGVRATAAWLRRTAALDAQICHDESRPCTLSEKSARCVKEDAGAERSGLSLSDVQPGVHGRQAVLPDVPVYLPASHSSQIACPAAAPNEPGRHGAGCAEPTEHAVPAGQTMH